MVTSEASGNGLSNNRVFASASENQTAPAAQNTFVGNAAYFTVNANHMIRHDYAVIKLNRLFESLNKIGIVKRFDATLQLWINTGTVNINIQI